MLQEDAPTPDTTTTTDTPPPLPLAPILTNAFTRLHGYPTPPTPPTTTHPTPLQPPLTPPQFTPPSLPTSPHLTHHTPGQARGDFRVGDRHRSHPQAVQVGGCGVRCRACVVVRVCACVCKSVSRWVCVYVRVRAACYASMPAGMIPCPACRERVARAARPPAPFAAVYGPQKTCQVQSSQSLNVQRSQVHLCAAARQAHFPKGKWNGRAGACALQQGGAKGRPLGVQAGQREGGHGLTVPGRCTTLARQQPSEGV